MKATPAALLAHMASGSTSLAGLWKVTRKDGSVYAFTDHDDAITYSALTYSTLSSFDASAVATRAEMNVDDLSVTGLLNSGGINADDLEAALWDGAVVRVWRVNWADLTMGHEIIREGVVGNIQRKGGTYTCEMRGMMFALQSAVGRIVLPTCDAEFGDTRCGKNITSLTHTGAVTTATSRWQITASALTQPAGYFSAGKVTFTSGPNAGVVREIKLGSGSGVLVFNRSLPYDPVIGNTLTAIAGCDKRASTCKDTHANYPRFRGFPDVPGPDQVLLIGGQA